MVIFKISHEYFIENFFSKLTGIVEMKGQRLRPNDQEPLIRFDILHGFSGQLKNSEEYLQ